MMPESCTYYTSPIGTLEIKGTEAGIRSILFVDPERAAGSTGVNGDIPACLQACAAQLDEYFQGRRKKFELLLLPEGTDFQKRAWQELQRIPYGETLTYGEQAERMGNKKAMRAVGGANGKNPLTVIVPCHRVIGKDGSLTGFGAGTWRKEWLLKHEQKNK